ncbi:uncharacterized protein J4E88_010630 [Alternaria novae-zelandiae]|uniref:uncharacterized protein n=1 Tax=Alternaria novae-zelandiae TaxID=430562 RepID=UPI0020C40CF1|nr:uncharacterized protein J4E88_010630 [Alternaria novae-zelandiae]KAI4665182.1 hypothetical protein J4E88_010630 [Alternaria novae-zelandiae]
MRFSFFVSASAAFLLAAAAPHEDVSLDEALKNFDYGAMMDLGRDGVLRSLNAAHDTVLDFVQLSGPQITEFFAKTGSDPSVMSGVYVCSNQLLYQ